MFKERVMNVVEEYRNGQDHPTLVEVTLITCYIDIQINLYKIANSIRLLTGNTR